MILICGASGALGSLVATRLRAIPGLELVTGSRTEWADRFVDFDRPDTLAAAFEDVNAALVISAGYAEDDVVCARHDAVVTAAERAGVHHLVYTSLAGSGEHLSIAVPHRYTEARLAASSVEVTVLRNGLYAELFAALTAPSRAHGVLDLPWGSGRFAPVVREDLADATANVLADIAAGRGARHAGAVYELDGVDALDGATIAETLGVRYAPAAMSSTRQSLLASGAPAYKVGHTMSIHANITAGLLAPHPTDLPALLDRAATPALDVVTRPTMQ